MPLKRSDWKQVSQPPRSHAPTVPESRSASREVRCSIPQQRHDLSCTRDERWDRKSGSQRKVQGQEQGADVGQGERKARPRGDVLEVRYGSTEDGKADHEEHAPHGEAEREFAQPWDGAQEEEEGEEETDAAASQARQEAEEALPP